MKDEIHPEEIVMKTDPICGMQVKESTPFKAEREGETFYFCSEHCRKTFVEEPEAAMAHAHSCCGGHGKSAQVSKEATSPWPSPPKAEREPEKASAHGHEHHHEHGTVERRNRS